ncbi:VVA0879 family protein [Streptosporangium jomthongense]|uniref:VVA0879 family protein n=1 Tax=Streptosporangium jomthongense TaxID=1193683 RepID=A0ABV8FDY5_9ACTN
MSAALTNAEWRTEGSRIFGTEDIMQWRFGCVSCGNVASPADFEALGANPRRAPHECIGRVHKEQGADTVIDGNSKPCNWTAGGMFRLSTLIEVESVNGEPTLVFPFAEAALSSPTPGGEGRD